MTLDSIIGDQTKPFKLNMYTTDTYMNRLDPVDPSKTKYFSNSYLSGSTWRIKRSGRLSFYSKCIRYDNDL